MGALRRSQAPVDCVCSGCGATFPHRGYLRAKNWCSEKCKGIHNRAAMKARGWKPPKRCDPLVMSCTNCGTEVRRPLTRVPKRTFCSFRCRAAGYRGKANPNWRGITQEKKCEWCGESFKVTFIDARNPGKFCSRPCYWKAKKTIHTAEQKRDAARMWSRRRESRERSTRQLLGHHEEWEWLELLSRYRYRCARCRMKRPLERDHIVPLSRGGNDLIGNIQPLCHRCNCKKNARLEMPPMKILAIDNGFRCGYAVLSNDMVRSGSKGVEGSSADMGLTFRSYSALVHGWIDKYKPDVVGTAIPFVGLFGTPVELIPIFGMFCKLQEIAFEAGLRFEKFSESDARKAFLSPAPTPRKSKDIKAAVIAACALRGWPATDNHAADALCAADFLLAKLDKGSGWDRTPLFIRANGKDLKIKGII